MRRTTFLILGLLGISIVNPTAAFAHPGTLTGTIPVGRTATVSINVPSEQTTPMTGFDVTAKGFVIAKASGEPGWTAQVVGGVVQVRGSRAPVGIGVLVSVEGTAPQAGVVQFDVRTLQADSSTFTWDGPVGSQNPALFVNAGSGGTIPDGSAKPTWQEPKRLVGAGIVVVGFAVVVWLLLQRRRRAV